MLDDVTGFLLPLASSMKLEYHKIPEDVESGPKNILCPQLAKLLDVRFPTLKEKYFVEKVLPVNDTAELKYWNNYIEFDQEIHLGKSTVIRGKGVGRNIGIPTANMDFPEALVDQLSLTPGIYYGRCMILETDNIGEIVSEVVAKSLPMVISIGFNLQYNQRNINYEVLILRDFKGEEFYGSNMKVVLQGFLRAEAKFDTFDMFIRAMECDIFVAKNIITQSGLF